MAYIETALLPIKATNKDAYFKKAAAMARLAREHGALSTQDGWAVTDDVMASAVDLEADERVAVSIYTWESEEARNAGWEKIQADPRMQEAMPMGLFDMQRAKMGRFES